MSRIAVVALGGNAITRGGQAGTFEEQAQNAAAMVDAICQIRAAGWQVVLVHGNGPQVGNLAVQQNAGASRVPVMPMFVLGAMTQGHLGSLLELALRRASAKDRVGVVSLVTHVVVDPDDPAFTHPTKPIGPFLSEQEARLEAAERGWTVGEDAGRGYRRLVPSPRPVRIVELDAVRALISQGFIVVAAGGGGVPVIEDSEGYRGIEAVIDKDLAAQRLATTLRADALVLITDVTRVMLDYGTPTARQIPEMTGTQAQAYAAAGQFPEGSMGPKVRASVQFLDEGGSLAVITDAAHACASLASEPGPDCGTRIVPARHPLEGPPQQHRPAEPSLGATT
ncbi:MAG TPA: carbamate kinase [Pseudonocardia sp.]|jgi:carbamate kinase|nr:carbamate kinase [Pseudonocardia sp.]